MCKVACYCNNNVSTKIEDVKTKFNFSPSKLSETIKFLKLKGVIVVTKEKKIEMQLNDEKQIRKMVFK